MELPPAPDHVVEHIASLITPPRWADERTARRVQAQARITADRFWAEAYFAGFREGFGLAEAAQPQRYMVVTAEEREAMLDRLEAEGKLDQQA